MPAQKRPKKARFYADENFFPKSVAFLKSKTFNVLHSVEDLGFQGRDDKFHFTKAHQLERILISLDTDFLDNRRYKLRKTSGVIVIVVPPAVTNDKVNNLVHKLIPVLKQGKEFFRMKKMKVTPDGLTTWSIDRSGKIILTTQDLG